jgi:hypothetical protein
VTPRELVERLRRLAAALAAYRRRVSEAVAGETGRLVAEAVGDVVTAALGGRPAPAWPRHGHRPWRDDDPDWEAGQWADTDDVPRRAPAPRLPAAAAAWSAVARWWRGRKPAWVGAGCAALAAAAVFFGGPALQAVVSLVTAAAELLS